MKLEVRVIPQPAPPIELTMTLSQTEALALKSVLGKVAGTPGHPIRRVTDEIFWFISDRVRPGSESSVRHPTHQDVGGNLYIK